VSGMTLTMSLHDYCNLQLILKVAEYCFVDAKGVCMYVEYIYMFIRITAASTASVIRARTLN
jgi:hypothetical protein